MGNDRGIASLAAQFAGAGTQLTHCGSGMHVHSVQAVLTVLEQAV